MLEKILRRFRLCKAAKKTAMFFAAFALTIVVMGVSFTEVRGDTAQTAQTTETAVANTAAQDLCTDNTAAANTTGQTATSVRMATLNTHAKQAVMADDGKSEPVILADARAKSVPIKLSEGNLQSQKHREFVYSDKIPLSYELQEYTFKKCAELDLEYELVLAVMWRESRFQSDAVNLNTNGTFDSGLMQINDVNREWLYKKLGIEDLMDPYQNIDAGTAMLSDLYNKYGEHGAMLAYQYGETGMISKVTQGVTTNKSIEAAYRQRDYYRQLI